MSDENMQAVLGVLEDACLATEKGKAPGNAKLVWMTIAEIATAGGMSEAAAEDGVGTGVREGLVSKGTGNNEGKYALNDPDLNQKYTV
ncbi:MAG TPA: hypothetical protein VLG36_04595 [Candidatus Chromulinivoraceae bacterium]|nr:hypothetical protein [Candidatus Chromulinivoraceae bacterium]